jgi:tetratricopeptide (TPR) repeat protein
MAFGFGFNKQKVLSAAEKFVQQGKLQNAIAEYEKILKNDPKDLTVTNTVGDLYARLGDNAKAVECFRSVGDAYAAQGFTVKGIAMYKKITKLTPSVDASLKLAELYTQQGLFNDARAQYLQVAEDLLKGGDTGQAIRLFQKVLEMDPDNVSMRVKLGEVYIKLGKKKEAWEVFTAAAEALRSKGSLSAAEDILQRMLKLDPANSYVLLMRGRAALESDDAKGAIQFLEKASDLDSHPDGLRDLLQAYLRIGDMTRARPLAEKLLSVHNDPEGLFLLTEGAVRLGQYQQALDVCSKHADRLLATDSAKLLASLHAMISHVRDDSAALDSLLQLLNKAGESTHTAEITELLAHACVQDGDLARARDLYQSLANTEPGNPIHMQNYQQVVERMAGTTKLSRITAEEGAVIIEELESTAPMVDQPYADEVAIAIRSAVTDADLFLSYNLPEKAVVPLLGALPQTPRDVRLNQRLAALHTRAHRFTEAAVCCRTLESVYHDAGFPDEAMRYGDLAERYEQNSDGTPSAADTVAPVAKAAAASISAAPAPSPAVKSPRPVAPVQTPPAAPEFEIQEMSVEAHHEPVETHHDAHDVSSEWEDSLSVEAAAPANEEAVPSRPPAPASAGFPTDHPQVVEAVEEARFYLEHFMLDQARSALEKLESLTSDPAVLDPLRAQIEAAGNQGAGSELAEVSVDDTPEFDINVDSHAEPTTSPDLAGYHDAHPAPARASAPEPEPFEIEPLHEEPAVVESMRHEPVHDEPAPAEQGHTESGDLASFVADLESSLGDSFPSAEPPAPEPLPAWPTKKPAAAPSAAPVVPPAAKRPASHKPAPEPIVARKETPVAGGAAAAAAPAPTMSYSSTPVRPLGAGAQAMHPAAGVDLSEMFGELKQELEEDVAGGSNDEDPETHYNLGVAFREMGLLDEAIAELQKVCTAMDRGQPFSQPVQTYTWLAQCFLDKGVPEAAIRWYEKALTIPGLDQDSRVAINYELGSACETAHDKPAALRHFTEVYGANIDYRDVAERIQALKS